MRISGRSGVTFFLILWLLPIQKGFAQSKDIFSAISPEKVMAIRATDAMLLLIQSHPDPELRRDIFEWLREKRLLLTFSWPILPGDMSLDVHDGNLYLIINPSYILEIAHIDSKIDRERKELVLSHEYVHLQDHFSGLFLIKPSFLLPEENVEDRAEHAWRMEFRAEQGEWAKAKKLNRTYLYPEYIKGIETYGEELGFLVVFHKFMQSSPQRAVSPEILEVWDKIFEREKALLLEKQKTPAVADVLKK